MSEQKRNILGTIFFLILLSSLFFLAFFPGSRINDEKPEEIRITGNYLLDQNDYLTFVKLKNNDDYKGLTLSVIKDRFQNHPYVEKADVKYEDKNSVSVYLSEKKIKALIVEDLGTYFLSGSHEIIHVLPHTKFIELPVITNSSLIMNRNKSHYGEIKQAIKIIDAAALTDLKLFGDLSEINLRNGGDVILSFNGIRPPVIFGRGEEARKMVYLQAFLNNKYQKEKLNYSGNYLDLRFSNRVFIGTSENPEIYGTVEKTGPYQ
jgi:cell division protein FtsQ